MSKKEENYKKYLYNNFTRLLNYIENINEYSEDWYEELVSYNNIIGSLIGLIDSKGQGKDFQNCKDFILRYYETTYPEKQLEEIDNALFSKNCYEYIKYSSKNLIKDERDMNILKQFEKAYLKGYTIGKDISLRSVLPYYAKKINEYSYRKNQTESAKTI